MNSHDHRDDLLRWAEHGGPIPWGLASHCRSCPLCDAKVRRIENLHASMTLLTCRPLSPTTYTNASRASVRYLKRAIRAKAEAKAALAASPSLSLWRRLTLHSASFSLTVATAVLVLIARLGAPATIERTTEWGERLADHHWTNHIDPDGDLLA